MTEAADGAGGYHPLVSLLRRPGQHVDDRPRALLLHPGVSVGQSLEDQLIQPVVGEQDAHVVVGSGSHVGGQPGGFNPQRARVSLQKSGQHLVEERMAGDGGRLLIVAGGYVAEDAQTSVVEEGIALNCIHYVLSSCVSYHHQNLDEVDDEGLHGRDDMDVLAGVVYVVRQGGHHPDRILHVLHRLSLVLSGVYDSFAGHHHHAHGVQTDVVDSASDHIQRAPDDILGLRRLAKLVLIQRMSQQLKSDE